MVIHYSGAPDLKKAAKEIVLLLGLVHIDLEQVMYIRSRGSKARKTLARIHGLPRIWQTALGTKPCYVLEVVSETFDKLAQEEQERVLIHEFLHIPWSFGGGFRHHQDWVDRRRVEQMHRILEERRKLAVS